MSARAPRAAPGAGAVVSVLVCAPDRPGAHRLAQDLGSGAVRLVGVALSPGAALRRLEEDGGRVDVVVVDDRVSPSGAWPLVRALGSARPGVGVVVTVADAGPAALHLALEAGARGVVARPVDAAELLGRVRAAGARSAVAGHHPAGGRGAGGADGTDDGRGTARSTVVVTGAKGGVGTTTLAVHLALRAASAGRSAVLVDLDVGGGDVGQALDVPHRRDVTDLLGVAQDLSDLALEEVLYRHRGGLRVLLAPRHGERAEEVTPAAALLVLAALAARFDVVVVDAGSGAGGVGAAAAGVADALLLVATPDLAALGAARRRAEAWQRAGVLPGARVVLSRVSRRSDVPAGTAGRLVGLPVAAAVVADEPDGLREAVSRRDPGLAPRRLVTAVAALADEVGAGGARTAGRPAVVPPAPAVVPAPVPAPLPPPAPGPVAPPAQTVDGRPAPGLTVVDASASTLAAALDPGSPAAAGARGPDPLAAAAALLAPPPRLSPAEDTA